jgi:hypothetical protein
MPRLNLFLLALLLPISALADVIESAEVRLPDGMATVSLVENAGAVHLRLKAKDSVKDSATLGEDFQEFTFAGKTKLLAVLDLDQDGQDEIAVRTTLPPSMGRFFVLRFDPATKAYEPIPFDSEKSLAVEYGDEVTLSARGEIAFELEKGSKKVWHKVRYTGQKFSILPR